MTLHSSFHIVFMVLLGLNSLSFECIKGIKEPQMESLEETSNLLQTSLLLLKCKLLQLATQLQIQPTQEETRTSPSIISKENKKLYAWDLFNITKDIFEDPKEVIQKQLPTIKYIKELNKIILHNWKKTNKSVIATKNLESYLAGLNPDMRIEYLTEEKELKPNKIRGKVSRFWIRNPAIRIFDDPLRSFLELVVNALDATVYKFYATQPAVGKFGVGFFSILSFLWKVPDAGSEIVIHCATKKNLIAPLNLFKLTINKKSIDNNINNDSITFDFEPIPAIIKGEINNDFNTILEKLISLQPESYFRNASIALKNTINSATTFMDALKKDQKPSRWLSIFPTGTIISIKPNTGSYKDETLKTVTDYLHYLDFYPHIATNVDVQLSSDKNISSFCIPQKQVHEGIMPHIQVTITPNCLEVADAGYSMTPFTLLTKLLIPSVSTKRKTNSLEEAQQKALEKIEKIEEQPDNALLKLLPELTGNSATKTESYIIITVNNVIVVKRKLQEPLIGDDGFVKDIVIHMPQATQLTLARNELSIAEASDCFEKKYLNGIIDATIEMVSRGNTPQLLLPLFKGLKEWEMQSAAHHIQGLFSQHLKTQFEEKITEKPTLIPIPEEFARQRDSSNSTLLSAREGKNNLIPINNELVSYNFNKFENYLKQSTGLNRNDNLIAGTTVIFLPDKFLKQKDGISHVTNLGLRTTIFAPESILQKKNRTDIINDVIHGFTQQELQPAKEIIDTTTAPEKEEDLFMLIRNGGAKEIGEMDKDHGIMDIDIFPESDLKTIFDNYLNNTSLAALNIDISKKFPPDDDAYFIMTNDAFKKTVTQDPNNAKLFYHFFDKKNNTISGRFLDFVKNKEATTENYQSEKHFKELFKMFGIDEKHIETLKKKYILYNVKDLKNPSNNPAEQPLHISKFTTNFIEFLFYKLNIKQTDELFTHEKKQLLPNSDNFIDTFAYLYFYYSIINKISPDTSKLPEPLKKLYEMKQAGIQSIFFETYGLSAQTCSTALTSTDNKNALLWFFNTEKTWTQSFKNFDLTPCLQQMIPLLVACQKDKDNPLQDKTIKKLENLKNSIWDLYKNCFSLDPSSFSISYGKSDENYVNIAKQDIDDYTVFNDVIKKLEESDDILTKLISFQIADFVNKINPHLQNEDLSKKCLTVPAFLANTPISFICFLKKALANKESLALALIKTTIQTCRTIEELMYVLRILTYDILYYLKKVDSYHESNIITFTELAIKYYIQEKVDTNDILAFYESVRESLPNRYNQTIFKYMNSLPFLNILEMSEKSSDVPSITTDLPEAIKDINITSKSFPLSSLIIAHMTANDGAGLEEDLKNYDLTTVIQKVNEVTEGIKNGTIEPFDLGKITQSIEAGSEKNALEAVAIETGQNSIDAVKKLFGKSQQQTSNLKNRKINPNNTDAYLKKATTISYSLAIKDQDDKKSSIVMTIKDEAGFPSLLCLLTDLVLPDYSNKTSQEGAIGDMGNGSFKLYQDALSVSFLTRLTEKPEKYYLLRIEPERNDLQVTDLKLTCEDVSESMANKDFWGTEIKIVFKPTLPEKTRINIITTQEFLRNCMGSSHAFLDDKKLYPFTFMLNIGKKEELLNPPIKTVLFEHTVSFLSKEAKEIFEKSYKARIEEKNPSPSYAVFRCLQKTGDLENENASRQSYITTAGVPFRPLAAYAREKNLLPLNFLHFILYGYIIDIDLAAYEPVQSRSSLNMNKELEKELRKALYEIVFISGIKSSHESTNSGNSEFATTHFLHFGSPISEFKQLAIGTQSQSDSLQKNITDFTNNGKIDQPIPEPLFFTFYQPYSCGNFALKSFYDYIDHEFGGGGIKSGKKRDIKNWTYIIEKINETKKPFEKKAHDELEKKMLENSYQNIKTKHEEIVAQIQNIQKNSTLNKKDLQLEYEKLENLNIDKGSLIPQIESLAKKINKEFKKSLTTTVKEWEEKNILCIPPCYTATKDFGLFKDVVSHWFKNKIESITLETTNMNKIYNKYPFLQMYKSIQKEMTNDDRIKSQKKRYPSIFKDCITYLFSSYITIFSKNVGVTNTISTLFEYDPSSSTEAFYDPKTTSITLNLARIEIASIVTFIIHMYDAIQKDISFLKNNETYKTYFRPKPGGKALTIIHELEHARRNSSHTDSASHGFSTDADGNPGKIFDICANSFGFKAIQEKLLEKWKEAVFNFIDNDKNTIEILRFKNISYDEKEDKEVLLKALELI